MKTRILISLLLVLPLITIAQKKKKWEKDSLITESGWIIHVGDTITTGLGTLPNGSFKYISDVSFGSSLTNVTSSNASYNATKYNEEKNALAKNFAGIKIVVKQIDNRNVYFKFGGKHRIFVEPAISTGEIIIPEKNRKQEHRSQNSLSKADELTKLKKLYEDGVLTKEEFEAEKKKLLDKN